jgi:hypothetical protein
MNAQVHMLEGVRDRKVQGSKMGFEGELYPSELAKLLTYGTDISGLELQMASQLWRSELLYQELDLAGGLPGRATRMAASASFLPYTKDWLFVKL